MLRNCVQSHAQEHHSPLLPCLSLSLVYIYPLKDIFLPRLLLVKRVGTSIFNHIKKEENHNKITTKVKKNRSFITKVISTFFLLTLYRLINNVD